MRRILFVEDNETVRKSYTGLLTQAGFEVTAAADSATALKHFELSPFDLAVIDIALGNDREAGFHLCTEIRKRSETLPIVFLTALDSDVDKISGMRLGADDYITKDVNADYLIVRIKALLRRMAVLSKQITESAEPLERGDLSLNMDTLTASWKNKLVGLSLTQLWMVYALARHIGHVRTPEQLMEAAKINVQPNTLTTHIANIRKKFQVVDPEFSAIKSERGAGYRWFVG
jgi:two-component system OmpR family response regulator